MNKIIRQKKVGDTIKLIRALMQKMGRPFVVYIYKIMMSRYEHNMCNGNFTMWAPRFFCEFYRFLPKMTSTCHWDQNFILWYRFHNLLAFNLVPNIIIFVMHYWIRAQNIQLCLKESKRINPLNMYITFCLNTFIHNWQADWIHRQINKNPKTKQLSTW